MKKILLLGGSSQQTIAIKKAKELGYYTILCDFLPDNPGQYEADKFYLVSTTDKEAVLKVAREEQINGVVAYSSDPAAPTAAYVAKELNLPGVPYETANSFCNKNLFRAFLKDNGFNVPASVEFLKTSDISVVSGLCYPIIVKPTDSSGSKGVSVIYSNEEFEAARDFAEKYSRNHVLIAEEYIEQSHKDVIECEIFVLDKKVAVWGIMSSVRDKLTNPLIPAAYRYPASISDEYYNIVKSEVSRLVEVSGVKNGAFNIEMVINKEGKLYFLDAGPRNGGNMLPEYISLISKSDIPRSTILTAMGDSDKISNCKLNGKDGGYWGLYVIHSNQSGILKAVNYSEEAKECLLREHYFKQLGSMVQPFSNSRDAIGLAFFKFPNEKLQDEILRDFTGKHVKLEIL